ncbi:DUF2461 domain-containing protein [Marinoscillum furvescens]|uniref:Uncharacterized protein (TIGR02453 family) n=1 Tax=Marinoscillum furvescens DSM 4134 TaxID=1122208 RepID=A0A3D9KWR4_MARFU|nr:DUF2461 domain-containing protein [Marinoscillum furvescens]RED92830.1 uncharacterized protein (TIGR02453 family) [Marinoscillum furvescens DSM 4134]
MQEVIDFLNALAANNNRDWFDTQKQRFAEVKDVFAAQHADIKALLAQHDEIEKDKVYRIYRDVRFSKDKTPYKRHLAGSFRRAGHYRRGGYYYQVQPGGSYIAGGFFGPNAQDLLHIRKQIQQEPEELRSIVSAPDFQQLFGGLQGEQLKTAPKGFEVSDPAIDLLRYKQFIVRRPLTDGEVLSETFPQIVDETFKGMRPFFDYMSEILTTDLNGESLYDE